MGKLHGWAFSIVNPNGQEKWRVIDKASKYYVRSGQFSKRKVSETVRLLENLSLIVFNDGRKVPIGDRESP
jgi:hypothetical protein